MEAEKKTPHEGVFSDIVTYAFVGAAGTGKSQRAQMVAAMLDADYIIDDGLIIYKGRIVCGKSAKSERNQISAIRRAMFEFDDHREEVLRFFSKAAPCSVMVIGTSENMVLKILKKLNMNPPMRAVRIEEVSSPEEIAKARSERFKKGQHVIPVSHVLVRKNFAGKLVGQLRVFWRAMDNREGEKTIVRPPFSFYGEVHIDPQAIEQIVTYIALRMSQVERVDEVDITPRDESISIEVGIAVTVGEKSFLEIASALKERVAVSIRYFTGIDVKGVDVSVLEVII
jgi:hypothetical protein